MATFSVVDHRCVSSAGVGGDDLMLGSGRPRRLLRNCSIPSGVAARPRPAEPRRARAVASPPSGRSWAPRSAHAPGGSPTASRPTISRNMRLKVPRLVKPTSMQMSVTLRSVSRRRNIERSTRRRCRYRCGVSPKTARKLRMKCASRHVGHRGHGADVERLGVGAVHRVAGAQEAPVQVLGFPAHGATLRHQGLTRARPPMRRVKQLQDRVSG